MSEQFILTKPFRVEVKGDKEVFLEGDISTTEPDLVDDIVSLKCLQSQLAQIKDRSIKLDFEHSNFLGSSHEEAELAKAKNPVGRILTKDARIVSEDGIHKLRVRSKLNPHHKDFKEIKGSVVDGFLDAYSIAYIPTKVSFVDIKGKTFRVLEDVTTLNVALTGIPINTSAKNRDVEVKSLNARVMGRSIDAHLKAHKKKRSEAAQREINAARNEDDDDDEEEDAEMKRYKKERKSMQDKLEVKTPLPNSSTFTGSDYTYTDGTKTIDFDSTEKKAYEADGLHVHNTANPTGEHTHPEIEMVMRDVVETFNRQISFLHERIDDLREGSSHEDAPVEALAMKNKKAGKKGYSVSGDKIPKLNKNHKEVNNMTENEADNAGEGDADKGTEDADAAAPGGDADNADADAGEGEANESAEAEVKNLAGKVKSMESDMKSLKEGMAVLLKAAKKPVNGAITEQKNFNPEVKTNRVKRVMDLLPR